MTDPACKDKKVHEIDVRVARLEEQHEANEKAMGLIATQLGEYKSANNEWRGTVQDIIAKNPTQAEMSVSFDRLADRITILEKQANTSQGKSSGFSASWGIAVSLVFLALALIGVILRMK